MTATATAGFTPKSAATGQPVQLAMQRLLLTGQVLPAGARLTVQHIFRSQEDRPLEVIYSFPLPRDAALRRFRITGDNFEAHSELKETEAAVKDYEAGIAAGHLSTLARQYGDGLINLTVGNIRPHETVTIWLEILAGVELRDDGLRFRFPFTLAPTYHASAKTALVAPGEGEMELPASEFGDLILPRFREDAAALHQIGFDLAISAQLDLDEIGSPSHSVRMRQNGPRGASISLATGHDVPNRDLVLDGRYKTVAPQILAGRTSQGADHFAAVLPSTSFGVNPESPRRVVILLDRSGSMNGEPIAQARKAIEACLGVLSDSDSFGLVAFDNVAECFDPSLQPATREVRDRARAFLHQVNARGGTELVTGFQTAANLLAGGSGDVLIMTDGQVSGAETILERARALNVRLHCLGIGSASQDRFLTLLARETGGVSRFVTPRERVDLSAVDLFASIGRPIAAKLKAGPNIQPEPPAAVFSGTPVLLFGEGSGPVELTWDGGRLDLPIPATDQDIAETLWLLQGARLITDWESRYPAQDALAPLEKRQQNRIATRLRDLSRTYGLASREMSLVAVVKRSGDRPGDLPDTRVVPVGMPQDTHFNAYFQSGGRMAGHTTQMLGASLSRAQMPMPVAMAPTSAPPAAAPTGGFAMRTKWAGIKKRWTSLPVATPSAATPSAAPPDDQSTGKSPEDILFDLAARLESDGGMPGPTLEERASSTAVAILAFLSQGHSSTTGAFRSHVARLVKFLKSIQGLAPDHQARIAEVIRQAEKGTARPGNWLTLAAQPGPHWSSL